MKKLLTTSVMLCLLCASLAFSASAVDTADAADTVAGEGDYAVMPIADGEDLLISPNPSADASIGIIGGADGPTAVIVSDGVEAERIPLNFEGIAAELGTVGILRGDGTSCNLEQVPDRMQACVMVVRMRGEEAAALAAYEAGEITCPFTDITDDLGWAKPYLAWLYEKKITLGVGDGKFGNSECTPQMYTTFMLRALGYADVVGEGEAADFSFDSALEFAKEKNLWDDTLAAETFNRGTMSAITYQTLTAAPKTDAESAPATLLEALVNTGAIDAGAAQPILDKTAAADRAQALYDAYLAKTGNGTAIAADIALSMSSVYVDSDGAEDTTYLNVEMNYAVSGEKEPTAMAVEGTVSTVENGVAVSIPLGMWISDGILYLDMMGEKVYMDASSVSEMTGTSLMGGTALVPYYMYTDVTITEENGMTYVTYDLTDLMLSYLTDMSGYEIGEDVLEWVRVPSVVASIAYDANGMISDLYFGMYQYLHASYDELGEICYTTETALDVTVSGILTGDDVVIVYPDFAEFKPAETTGIPDETVLA